MAKAAHKEAPKTPECKCRSTRVRSEKYCVRCGGLNPFFSMRAYRIDYGDIPLGQDCRQNHRELREAIMDFPQYPYCAHCGYDAKPINAPT